MGHFREAVLGEVRVYDDPQNPEGSQYSVVLPITTLAAIFNESGKNLKEILAGYSIDVLTQEELDEYEDPVDSGLYPALAGRVVIIKDDKATGGGSGGSYDDAELRDAIANILLILFEKADLVHGHAITAVAGLQDILGGKAASTHDHAIANVTSLQTTLDAKAAKKIEGTGTIPITSWTTAGNYKYVNVTCTGVVATDSPVVGVKLNLTDSAADELIQGAWNTIKGATAQAGAIRFFAKDVPTVAIPIQWEVSR